MSRPRALIAASVVFIAVMLVVVPWLTRTLLPRDGYFAVFCLYWLCFCLPAGWFFGGRTPLRERLSLATEGNRWVPWAVTLQVFAIAIGSWTMLPDHVALLAVALALVFGPINGFFEEFFWRGAFLEQMPDSWRYQALGVGLFTLWHVPLALAHGVTYPGGAASLVGGAAGLGAFWAFVAYRTKRIGWPVVSHMLTNAIAFVGLIALNFV